MVGKIASTEMTKKIAFLIRQSETRLYIYMVLRVCIRCCLFLSYGSSFYLLFFNWNSMGREGYRSTLNILHTVTLQ